MIDWFALFATGLWVTGVAILLAAISWRFYAASVAGASLRTQFAAPSFTLITSVGMMLWLAGLALRRGGPLWMALIWAALALGFAYVAWLSWTAWRHQSTDA